MKIFHITQLYGIFYDYIFDRFINYQNHNLKTKINNSRSYVLAINTEIL